MNSGGIKLIDALNGPNTHGTNNSEYSVGGLLSVELDSVAAVDMSDTRLLGLARWSLVWNAGYWRPHVGFYGGVNYGFDYGGHGYEGGRWRW